jgi:hypothetical protein
VEERIGRNGVSPTGLPLFFCCAPQIHPVPEGERQKGAGAVCIAGVKQERSSFMLQEAGGSFRSLREALSFSSSFGLAPSFFQRAVLSSFRSTKGSLTWPVG